MQSRENGRPDSLRGNLQKVFLFLLLFCLVCSSALAAGESFTLNREDITVSGDDGQTVERLLTITNSLPTHNLTVRISFGELNREDNREVFKATHIQPDDKIVTIEKNSFVRIPVTFDLKDIPGGKYSGKLQISSNTTPQKIPVTVNVKASPLWPAVVLVVSTLASVIFFDYALNGYKSDKLRLRIAAIERKLKEDGDLQAKKLLDPFRQAVLTAISAVEAKIQEGDLSAAETAMTAADTAWGHWSTLRGQWMSRLMETEEIETEIREDSDFVDKVQERVINHAFFDIMKNDLVELWQTAAVSQKTPDDISKMITECKDRLAHFRLYFDEITKLFELPEIQSNPKLKDCVRKLQRDLLQQTFTPNDSDNTKKFTDAFPARCKECLPEKTKDGPVPASLISEDVVKSHEKTYQLRNERLAASDDKSAPPESAASPVSGGIWSLCSSKYSWIRLNLFLFCHSIFVPAIILILIGYNQFYIGNPTFGAGGVGDYSQLVFWGFMCGPASDTVVTLVNARAKMPK